MEDNVRLVPLQELIDVANKYISGEFTEEELNEYGQTLRIRGYIPLAEKVSYVMNLMNVYQYSDYNSQEIRIGDLYKNLFFYVLLGGYMFIDCSDLELITYENYDLLYPMFAQFILSFCERDFNVLKDMLKDSLNLLSLENVADAVDSIDIEAMEEATKSNENFIRHLEQNKELVEKLNNIVVMNDPLTNAVVEELRKIDANDTDK